MHHDVSNPVIVTPNVVDGPQNQHRELETAVVVESQAGRGGAKPSTDLPSVTDEGRSDSSGLSDADGGDRCVKNPIFPEEGFKTLKIWHTRRRSTAHFSPLHSTLYVGCDHLLSAEGRPAVRGRIAVQLPCDASYCRPTQLGPVRLHGRSA